MWECVCVYQPVCMPLWLSLPLEQTRKDQIYVYSRPSARSSWCTKTLLVPHEFPFRLPPLLIDSGVEWLTDWQARSIDNKDRIECTSVWQLPPPIVCPYPLSLFSLCYHLSRLSSYLPIDKDIIIIDHQRQKTCVPVAVVVEQCGHHRRTQQACPQPS